MTAKRVSARPGPIRVLYVITGLGPGGAEMMLRKLVLGHDPRVVLPAVISCGDLGVHGAAIRSAGIPVWCLNMRRGTPTPGKIIAFARIIRAFRPHMVQSWLYHADFLLSVVRLLEPAARSARWTWNVRCSLAEAHGRWSVLRLLTWVLAGISNRPDAVIANSHAGIAHHREIGYHPRRWIVLPNGFDCERFRPDPSARKRLCHELGLSVGTEVVSLIARYDPLKDHENFTSSFAVLLKQRPGIHAVLVGKNVTKENRDLMNMVLKNGIEDSISLLGERNDLPLIMGASSVVVLSSRAEGFPNVVGEAMACGTPCVVTDVGDARWIVGQTGIVVSPRAPSALAEGILTLLAEKPVERLARGEMARDRILTLFELSSVVARYEKTYMAMIGSEAPCSGVARRIRGAGKKCRVPVEWSR